MKNTKSDLQVPSLIHDLLLIPAYQFDKHENFLFNQGRYFTYMEILEKARRISSSLLKKGVQPNDLVGLLLNNSVHFVAVLFGVLMVGARVTALSPRSSAQRIRKIAEDGDIRFIICEDDLAIYEELYTICRDRSDNVTLSRLCELQDEDCIDINQVFRPDPEDIAYIQYTSGSTGPSKGVMLSHRAILANCISMSKRLQIDPKRDIFTSMLPLYHDMGLIGFLFFPLYFKTKLVMFRQDIRNIYSWLRSFAEHGATISGASNTMLHLTRRVVDNPSDYDLSNLRAMLCGSEPIYSDVVQSFRKTYGLGDVIVPAYGLAESTLCVTMHDIGKKLKFDDKGIISCGRPIPETEIVIEPGYDHKIGEILVRSASMMTCYYNDVNVSSTYIDNAGFLHTGDLGYLGNKGELYVLGRIKNIIIKDGVNLLPSELEIIALKEPEVRNCCVVGIASKEDGGREQVSLVIEVSRKLMGADEILKQIKSRIIALASNESSYLPDRCFFVPAGLLPVSLNGKMQHLQVRQIIEVNEIEKYEFKEV